MRAVIVTGLALCLAVAPLSSARAAPPSHDPELELKLRKAKGLTDTGIIVLRSAAAWRWSRGPSFW